MRQRQHHDADKPSRSGTVLPAVTITSMAGSMAARDNLTVTTAPRRSARTSAVASPRRFEQAPTKPARQLSSASIRPRPPSHPLIG
jgi:hypothetical protein